MDIRSFALAWRWTQPSHTILPEHVLTSMRPLHAAEISGLQQQSGSSNLIHVVSFAPNDRDKTCSWLRQIEPNLEKIIHIDWTSGLGIELKWEYFTSYWDDFCYPSSDDVTIIPTTADWKLRFHHFERFDFFQPQPC